MIGNSQEIIQWLFNQSREKQYTIKEYKAKRSLSQNAYAWKLISKMADLLNQSKEEVYIQMLKDFGQSEIISTLSEVNIDGYFKYFELMGKSNIKNKEFSHYKIYKGSSEFDSKEMTIFINGIIQECKQLGIETLTPDEIALLNLI